MEYLQSLAARLSKVVAIRKMCPLDEIPDSDSRQGLDLSSNPERHALALGTSTFNASGYGHTEVANIRRYFRYCPVRYSRPSLQSNSPLTFVSFFLVQRKREKRPMTVGCKRVSFSSKNAVQVMTKLDRIVQLHVANIRGRTLPTSPTAMQVLRFVTLIDATGREHPILMQCCTSFEVRV